MGWGTRLVPTRPLTCFDLAFQGLLLSALGNFIGHKAQGQDLIFLLFYIPVFLSSSRKDDQIFLLLLNLMSSSVICLTFELDVQCLTFVSDLTKLKLLNQM